jgi:hypothetical protein
LIISNNAAGNGGNRAHQVENAVDMARCFMDNAPPQPGWWNW